MKALSLFIVLFSILLIVGGCQHEITIVDDINWEEELASCPDSLYWNAFGEAESRDMQMAIDKATLLARGSILRAMGKTNTILRLSRIVRFKTWSKGEPGLRIYRAKVLVSAPKSLNLGAN